MKSTPPTLSVLIPTYNGGRYVFEAIQSILNQTYQDFELLIIDDGSTDNTSKIIQSFNDPRIRWFRNEKNEGLIATLNRGLELAQGQLIARMDSDDLSLPDRFEKQIHYLNEHPDVSVVGGAYETIEENVRIVRHPTDPEQVRQELLFTGCVIAHPTVMFRKKVLEDLGFTYDKNYPHAEDYALWAKLSQQVKLANLPDVLLRYRVHSEQASIQFESIQQKGAARVKAMLLAQFVPEEKRSEVLIQLTRLFADTNLSTEFLREARKTLKAIVEGNRRLKIFSPRRLESFLADAGPGSRKIFGLNFLRNAKHLGSLSLISVKVWGNLGDQLFQYALGVHLEAMNLESVGYDYEEYVHFRRHSGVAAELRRILSLEPTTNNNFLFILKGFLRKIFYRRIKLESETIIPRKRKFAQFEKYVGHFRNENFFVESRTAILSKFNFSEAVSRARLTSLETEIAESESLGVHIVKSEISLRDSRVSYGSWPSVSPPEFYRLAIQQFKSGNRFARYFVFTDDPAWCSDLIPETKDMTFVTGFSESSLASLRLLSLCKHQILASNSFGWWAAWLNPNQNKTSLFADIPMSWLYSGIR